MHYYNGYYNKLMFMNKLLRIEVIILIIIKTHFFLFCILLKDFNLIHKYHMNSYLDDSIYKISPHAFMNQISFVQICLSVCVF